MRPRSIHDVPHISARVNGCHWSVGLAAPETKNASPAPESSISKKQRRDVLDAVRSVQVATAETRTAIAASGHKVLPPLFRKTAFMQVALAHAKHDLARLARMRIPRGKTDGGRELWRQERFV